MGVWGYAIWQILQCGLEHEPCLLCVAPAQCTQVLCMRDESSVMRSRCVFTRLPFYGCLGEQHADATSTWFGGCAFDGRVVL